MPRRRTRLRRLLCGLAIYGGAALPHSALQVSYPSYLLEPRTNDSGGALPFDRPPPHIRNHGFIFKTVSKASKHYPARGGIYIINTDRLIAQEPTFRAESFDIMRITDDKSRLQPGYLFIDPSPKSMAWGPHIYDMEGNLVWHGPLHWNSQDFHVCDYKGSRGTHLCLRLIPKDNRILDSSYQLRPQHYTYAMKGSHPDGHDFNMLPGGRSFLQPVAVPTEMDLRVYGGRRRGEVLDCCFEEIKTATGKPIFGWCYLDHLPIWETTLYPKKFGGSNITSPQAGGGTKRKPWDFCHMNAIDKMEGDYIVSLRHLDQIVSVAGPETKRGVEPGTVLWRLGGRSSDFDMEFMFSKQHDVRLVSVTEKETRISLLDNSWEGNIVPTANASSGKIISLNNETMKATLVNEYPHPDGMVTASRGSVQVQPNGNVFVGWGAIPDITEFDENGELLYHARFAIRRHNRILQKNYRAEGPQEFSYRAVKAPWVGKPAWDPKMVLVAHPRRGSITAFVSWNGATEVKRWRFFVKGPANGTRIPAGTFDRSGFETKARLTNTHAPRTTGFLRVVVEALDADDKVLATIIVQSKLKTRNIVTLFALVAFACLVVFLEAAESFFSLHCWRSLGTPVVSEVTKYEKAPTTGDGCEFRAVSDSKQEIIAPSENEKIPLAEDCYKLLTVAIDTSPSGDSAAAPFAPLAPS